MHSIPHRRTLVTALFTLASAAHWACGAEPPASEGAVIRVITYNVQFLPGLAESRNERPRPAYRAGRIAEEVSRFDIVALQEVFHDQRREQILAGIRQAWEGQLHEVTSPMAKGHVTHGGCMILTRRPILQSHAVVYENFSKTKDYGFRADGLAAKGALHARIGLAADDPESYVDVYATHLEARADELRPLQYAELARFIQRTSDPARPLLLLGDMNTRGMLEYWQRPESQYAQMMRSLSGSRGEGTFQDVWRELRDRDRGGTTDQQSPQEGKRIDYIFLSNPRDAGHGLEPISIEVNCFRDPKVTALSDHNAVTATFQWHPAR